MRDPFLANTVIASLPLVPEENKVVFDVGLALAGIGRTGRRQRRTNDLH